MDERGSPCIAICSIDRRFGYCSGCGRTLAEIEQWAVTSPAVQAGIWEELPLRMKRMKPSLKDSLRHLLDRNPSA